MRAKRRYAVGRRGNYPERMTAVDGAIKLEPIERPPKSKCHSCGAASRHFKVETIDTHPVPDMPSRFYYTIDWGRCPLCGAENCFLQIDVVSDAPDGRQFFNDYCWQAAPGQWYAAQFIGHAWLTLHHTNVRDASFEALPGERSPTVTAIAWLDSHYFPTFAALNLDEAIKHVRAIARAVQPVIEAMQWQD